jgi:hypothetical protein
MRRLSPSREQRIRQLLTFEMGDRKPSQFLRHLRSLAPDVLHTICSSQPPPHVQAILACQHKGSLDVAACSADPISEVASQPVLACVGPPPDSTALLRGIEGLSRQVAAYSVEQIRLRLSSRNPCSNSRNPRPCSRNRRPGNRFPSRGYTSPTIAATEPGRKRVLCSAPTASRETQQTSLSAHVWSTTGRHFITDRST